MTFTGTSAQAWEGDERNGFPWLIEELSLPVSAEALRLRSKSERWSKGGKPSLEIKTKLGAKPKKEPDSSELVVKNSSQGRPSAYKQEFDEWAYWMCVAGAIDEELASAFHVTQQTITRCSSF